MQMPHLVLEPAHQTALSQFMQWLLTSHVRRYHKHYGTSGHIWQGRFKSFPVQRDEHLITVLRYVLQNPVRAGLSETIHEWPWSSARRRQLIDRLPTDEESSWSVQLENPLEELQVVAVRECLNRQRPTVNQNGKGEWLRLSDLEAHCAHAADRAARRKVACPLYDFKRYATIDLRALSELCGFGELADFQRAQRQWIEEALAVRV